MNEEIDLTNLPPQNVEIEKAFLATMIQIPEHAAKAIVREDDFYMDAHGHIWRTIRRLSDKREQYDMLVIFNEMKKDPKIPDRIKDGIGSKLAEIIAEYPISTGWKKHEEIILETKQQRELIKIYRKAIEDLQEGGNPNQIAHDVRSTSTAIVGRQAVDIITARALVHDCFEMIERRSQTKDLTGIDTGFRDVNKLIDGWQDGELIIVAARPGMGKTAFADATMTAGAEKGYPTAMINLEMGPRQLGIRSLSGRSNIPITRLRKGMITGEPEWKQLGQACGEIADLPMYYTFSAFDETQISQTIDRLVTDKGCKMIGVDYLQLVQSLGTKRQDTREQEVARVTKMLKRKTLEHKIPIMALAQLNRGPDNRADKRPNLADLRESGEIEQSADMVIFLYRDEYYDKKTKDRGIAEAIFAKGRNNAVDVVKLAWIGPTTSYKDLAPQAADYHRAGDEGDD